MKPANNAPVYAAALYPGLAEIFREHGYALAVHGSLASDFDLIAVPWADEPSSHEVVLEKICKKFAIRTVGTFETKKSGRIAYTVSVGFGNCFLDLSFFPGVENVKPRVDPLKQSLDLLGYAAMVGLDVQKYQPPVLSSPQEVAAEWGSCKTPFQVVPVYGVTPQGYATDKRIPWIDSVEVSAAIDRQLQIRSYPSSSKEAARAGFLAALEVLQLTMEEKPSIFK